MSQTKLESSQRSDSEAPMDKSKEVEQAKPEQGNPFSLLMQNRERRSVSLPAKLSTSSKKEVEGSLLALHPLSARFHYRSLDEIEGIPFSLRARALKRRYTVEIEMVEVSENHSPQP